MASPLQGFTDAAWRRLHAELYAAGGPAIGYFTPFARIERGEVRRRDLAEMTAAAAETSTAAQVICRDADEFALLADAAIAAGCRRIDLNAGCPFPPQVKHGRGSALIARPQVLADIAEAMRRRPQARFSMKMRLGVKSPQEWRASASVIAAMPLEHVAVHPRTARQQYAGELHHTEFDAVADASRHNTLFNGDILAPADIDRVRQAHPDAAGVMVGRGLLSRPSLLAEWVAGSEWTVRKRQTLMLTLADRLLADYERQLCGSTQILLKIKPFWNYFAAAFDNRRLLKGIAKSGSLTNYRAAVDELRATLFNPRNRP